MSNNETTNNDQGQAEELNVIILQIAKTCHEVNRAYCQSIGDNSQKAWEDCEAWQRKSAVQGVIFTLDNPDSKPSDNHVNWLKDKEADGWVYGEVKDPSKKEHPCMVPYEELPEAQKTKDLLFQSVVKSFMHD